MKKTLVAMTLVLLIALSVVGPVSAQKNKINIKGEVTAVDGGTLTVASNKGETYIITIPAGMDVSTIKVGASVLIKATAGQGGAWIAESVKQTGNENDNAQNNNDDEDKAEGFKENSAFCADGKQEKSHPLAPKIAERFGVSQVMVMEYFCEGYSIGTIMLAIKTSQLEGVTSTLDDLLTSRADGNGWGLIWKDLGLIGSEKEGHSPPGLLKKMPKNKD